MTYLIDSDIWLELLFEQERADHVRRRPVVTEDQAAIVAKARDGVRGAKLLALKGLS